MTVFADTLYWIALTNPRDQWHQPALAARAVIEGATIVTTDAILAEYLARFAGQGQRLRELAATFTRGIPRSADVTVVEFSRSAFLQGLGLYEQRLDKGYSLVDCVSMETMRDRGITDVLTNDHHFAQEGFTVLIGAS